MRLPIRLKRPISKEFSLKFLFLSYKAPPINHPGAIRLFHLAVNLLKSGMKVYFQTSTNQHFFPQDDALKLSRTPMNYIDTRDIRSITQQSTIPAKDKEKAITAFLHRLYHAYPFILFTGDGGWTYIRRGKSQASRLIEQEKITHIFSSYRPWADHVIAYRLKKKYPHLIWIADFRDRAVDPIRMDVWWLGLQRWWQRRVLKRVDLLITVSEGLAQHFREDHPQVTVVRNGMPSAPHGFLTAPVSSHFTIMYTGAIYPALQQADLLFSALRRLINAGQINPAHVELHYAGKDGEIWQSWARKYSLAYLCVQHGFISSTEAHRLQQKSQLNLLLSWSAPNYGGIMTAKLGSYLAAGRPILGLLNGPNDPELRAAVEETGAGKLFLTHEPPEDVELFLLDLYRTWQFSGAVPWRTSPEKLSPYTWSQQITHLLQAIPKEN